MTEPCPHCGNITRPADEALREIGQNAHDAAVTADCQAIEAERANDRYAPHLRDAAKALFTVSARLDKLLEDG